jgi:hypothetical protein
MLKFIAPLVVLTLVAACGAPAPDAPVASRTDPLYIASDHIWSPFYIPVCWEEAGHDTEKGWVRERIADTWERYTSVQFTGWGTCSDNARGIRIQVADEQCRTQGLGNELDGMRNGMRLNFTFSSWDHGCIASHGLQDCITFNAAHEFGHALGFAHEQNRPDTPSSCNQRQGSDGDETYGAWDADSIMNYCNDTWDNGGQLSATDAAGAQKYYGKPASGCGRLTTNEFLTPGTTMNSCGLGKVVFQENGDLAVYGPDGGFRWHSDTGERNANRAIMQTDGNFVIYTSAGVPIWNTGTANHPGAYLQMQADGNLVLYAGSSALWASNTRLPGPNGCRNLWYDQQLALGESVTSCNGHVKLTFTAGELVLKVDNVQKWSSGTGGSGAYTAILQHDGNFVLYNREDRAVWNTGTPGHTGAHLQVQNDNNVVLYASNGGLLWSTSTWAAQPSGCRDLRANQQFLPGYGVSACNGSTRLTLQTDGNLVLKDGSKVLWSSGTAGKDARFAMLQNDGNFVIYDSDDQAIWNTGVVGNANARLSVQNDGNLVLYRASGSVIWTTNTAFARPSACKTLTGRHQLAPGDELRSCDGRNYLTFQTDGNLVLYRDFGGVLWASNTQGWGGYTVVMQADGNLVMYRLADEYPLWQSGTAGYPGARLDVQNDANAVVYDSGNHARWATNTSGSTCSGVRCGSLCCTGSSWCSLHHDRCCTMPGQGCGVADFAPPPPPFANAPPADEDTP